MRMTTQCATGAEILSSSSSNTNARVKVAKWTSLVNQQIVIKQRRLTRCRLYVQPSLTKSRLHQPSLPAAVSTYRLYSIFFIATSTSS